MSKLLNLLANLEKVKRTGQDSYVACCPAHADRNPSMTIREVEDGRILLHCFAGCSVEEVLGAVGMTFDDVFPDRVLGEFKPERQPFNARDVLAAVSTESLIVAIAGADIAKGAKPTPEERKRLLLAVSRLQEAVRLCHV